MLDWPARLILSPVLISQALIVRRTAQSLPEAAGPRNGTSGDGPALSLRIIGDSSAAGVGVTTQAQALSGQLVKALAPEFRVDWHLDALTGSTTASTLARLDTATPQKIDVIVTALGVNDVTRLIPVKRWCRLQDRFLKRLRVLYDPDRIYVSAVPPVGAFPLLPQPLRWTLGRQASAFERAQRAFASTQPDVTLIPFDQPLDPALMASDGFHPTADVYTLWAEEIAQRIVSDRKGRRPEKQPAG